jgi:hypothetical protein
MRSIPHSAAVISTMPGVTEYGNSWSGSELLFNFNWLRLEKKADSYRRLPIRCCGRAFQQLAVISGTHSSSSLNPPCTPIIG